MLARIQEQPEKKMVVKQRRFSNKTTFIFEEHSLTYAIKDQSGTHTFSIDYDLIPEEKREYEERNQWFRNLGMFWVLIGVGHIVYRYMEQEVLRGSFWLTLGIICYVVYWLARTNYTIIPTESGSIYIIKNKKHDDILREIHKRRESQLDSTSELINRN